MSTATGFALDQSSSIYVDNEIIKGFNDIYMDSSGNLATVNGVTDLIQTIKNALWLWIKEYEFNTKIGLSYLGVFNNNSNNVGIFTQQIEDAILQCNDYLTEDQYNAYGIKSVDSIDYAVNETTRKVVINVHITLNDGTQRNIIV